MLETGVLYSVAVKGPAALAAGSWGPVPLG
jgi:hypothetical protein